MRIDEFFTIETDAYNFTLKLERATGKINEKTGKEEIHRNEWHFPKFSQAIDKYLNESLRPAKDIAEVNATIKQLESKINSL